MYNNANGMKLTRKRFRMLGETNNKIIIVL